MKVCPKCGQQYADTMKFCPRDGGVLQMSATASDAETVISPPPAFAAPQTVAGDPLIGRVLAGRYQILSQIGQGGMGTVYRAQHAMLGRVDAVKIIRSDLKQSPETMQRFLREAKLASSINHPNAVVIHDFGEAENGIIYLAMEFIQGKSLEELIRQESPLPIARAIHISRQIAQALDAAHRLSIVHRDLKPDNVLILNDDFVKVVDFGIAKSIAANETGKSVTQAGFVIGTPKYMAPEQVLGEAVDARADIFSLALVTYEMLTGASPFSGASSQAQMVNRVALPPISMNVVRPGFSIPVEIDQVVIRALSREPSARQATAGTFAEELEAAFRKSTFDRTQSPGFFPRTEQFNSTGGGGVVSTGPQQTVITEPRPVVPTVPVTSGPTYAGYAGNSPTLPPAMPPVNGSVFQTPGSFPPPVVPTQITPKKSRLGLVLGLLVVLFVLVAGAGIGGYFLLVPNPRPGPAIGNTPPETPKKTDSIRAAIEHSRELRESGNLSEALNGIETELKEKPDSRELLIEKAEILFEQDKIIDSEDIVYRVLKSHPDFPPAHQNIGVLKYRQNKIDEAIAAEKKCLELKPEPEYGCYAHSVLAYIYMGQYFSNRKKFAGKLTEAENEARSAISLATRKSLESSPRLALAQIYVERKQYVLAREQTDKILGDNALKKNSDLAGVHAQIAVIAFFEKKFPEAAAEAQKAAELDPKNENYKKMNENLKRYRK